MNCKKKGFAIRFRQTEETICCAVIANLVSVCNDFLHFHMRKRRQTDRFTPNLNPPRAHLPLSRLNTLCCTHLFSLFTPQLEPPRWQTALTVIGCLIFSSSGTSRPMSSQPCSLVSHPKPLAGGQNPRCPVWSRTTSLLWRRLLVHTAETFSTSTLSFSQLKTDQTTWNSSLCLCNKKRNYNLISIFFEKFIPLFPST